MLEFMVLFIKFKFIEFTGWIVLDCSVERSFANPFLTLVPKANNKKWSYFLKVLFNE